jgi:hypothetical protein
LVIAAPAIPCFFFCCLTLPCRVRMAVTAPPAAFAPFARRSAGPDIDASFQQQDKQRRVALIMTCMT